MGQFYVNRSEAFGLSYFHEGLAHEFEQRDKGHHENRRATRGVEQLGEFTQTRLIELVTNSTSPQFSAGLANEMAAQFIEEEGAAQRGATR